MRRPARSTCRRRTRGQRLSTQSGVGRAICDNCRAAHVQEPPTAQASSKALLPWNAGRRVGSMPSRFCLARAMQERSSASSALMLGTKSTRASRSSPAPRIDKPFRERCTRQSARVNDVLAVGCKRCAVGRHVVTSVDVCSTPITRQHTGAVLGRDPHDGTPGDRRDPARAARVLTPAAQPRTGHLDPRCRHQDRGTRAG